MSLRRSRWFGCALAGLLPLSASCNLLVPVVFIGDHKQKVSPEFDKLAGKRVAVLVWVEPSTLFDYQYARLELATYVADKLQTEMTQRGLGTDVVKPRDVEEFLQKNVDAHVNPAVVGRQFKTDYVIYLEVSEFQIRDPQEPQLLRGRIAASVSVHDVADDPSAAHRFELAPVECVHPEDQPVLLSEANSSLIREGTYRKFAELVARKFYEHTIDL
jgi:hypothetical protein